MSCLTMYRHSMSDYSFSSIVDTIVWNLSTDIIFFAFYFLLVVLSARVIIWLLFRLFALLRSCLVYVLVSLRFMARNDLDSSEDQPEMMMRVNSMRVTAGFVPPGPWSPDRIVVREPPAGFVPRKWYSVTRGRYPGVYYSSYVVFLV